MHIKMPDVQVLRENGLILLPGTEWAAVSTNCPFRQSSSSGFGTLHMPPHPGPVLLIPITDWFLKVSVTLWLYCHHLFFFFPLNICGFFHSTFIEIIDMQHCLSCTELNIYSKMIARTRLVNIHHLICSFFLVIRTFKITSEHLSNTEYSINYSHSAIHWSL